MSFDRLAGIYGGFLEGLLAVLWLCHIAQVRKMRRCGLRLPWTKAPHSTSTLPENRAHIYGDKMNNEKIILLVEDNPSDIALTERALTKAGVDNRIVVVEDGQAALDYLLCPEVGGERPIPPTLILLDLNLPLVSGLEVLKQIRADQRTRRLPVVILTTSSEPREIGAGYDLGANSYLIKPINFVRFAEVVQHLGLYWLLLNEAPPV